MKIFGIEFGNSKPQEIVPEDGKMEFHSLNRVGSGDLSDPYIEMYRGNGPVYFGQDNLFPQHLDEMFNSSSLHSSIVEFKKELIAGGGFKIEGESYLDASKKLELSQFINYIDGQHTLEEKLKEITMDYIIHGVVYFKLFWNSDKSKTLKIERVGPSKLRVGLNKEYEVDRFYQCFDWRESGRYGMTEIPKYEYGSKNRTDIIRFATHNPISKWYTLPSYYGASNWIDLDGQIGYYHKSNIENSINPSLIFKFSQPTASEEEKKGIIRNIQSQGKGAKNAGRSMVFFSDGKDNQVEIQTVEVSNIDKQFNVTADAIQRNICYAHRINPMILGFKTPGSLGNSTEFDVAYEIFTKSVIQPAQRDIEAMINKLFRLKGLDVKFVLNENDLYTPKNNTQA